MTALRRSALVRWLVALLLLAALAWGLGELRSERGTKPELGVGDLRPSEVVGPGVDRTASDENGGSGAAPAAAAVAPNPADATAATGEP